MRSMVTHIRVEKTVANLLVGSVRGLAEHRVWDEVGEEGYKLING